VVRLPAAPAPGTAGSAAAPGFSICLSSAIWASICRFWASKPSMAAVRMSGLNLGMSLCSFETDELPSWHMTRETSDARLGSVDEGLGRTRVDQPWRVLGERLADLSSRTAAPWTPPGIPRSQSRAVAHRRFPGGFAAWWDRPSQHNILLHAGCHWALGWCRGKMIMSYLGKVEMSY
jgi:hypothetical protein